MEVLSFCFILHGSEDFLWNMEGLDSASSSPSAEWLKNVPAVSSRVSVWNIGGLHPDNAVSSLEGQALFFHHMGWQKQTLSYQNSGSSKSGID